MRPGTLQTQECPGLGSCGMYGVIGDWFFGTASVPFQGSSSPRWDTCSDSYEDWDVVIWIETTELRSSAFNLWAVHMGLLWPVWDKLMTASFAQVLRVPLPVLLSPVLLAIVTFREASAFSSSRRFTQSSSSLVLILSSNRTRHGIPVMISHSVCSCFLSQVVWVPLLSPFMAILSYLIRNTGGSYRVVK